MKYENVGDFIEHTNVLECKLLKLRVRRFELYWSTFLLSARR